MIYKKIDVFNGVIWSAIDKFSIVAVTLIFEILIARLLSPNDYGIIGMISVFVVLGQVFIDGGFSVALIQKTDRTESDFSTAFYFNLFLAIVVYIVIFVSSPLISNFYDIDLTLYIRLISINIILNSLVIVHRAKLSILLDFKTQAKFSFLAVLISGLFGFGLAYSGYGIWALIVQSISLSFFTTIFFWIKMRWLPEKNFSRESFNSLFSFGSNLLLSSVIQAVYQNLYSIVIGKSFSSKELGLYTKSTQFSLMPITMMTNVLQRVSLPYFSSFKNDLVQLYKLYLKYTKIICIIFFPGVIGFMILAKNFVLIFLSNSWSETIPILQILLITFIFYPIIVINMTILQVRAKTKIFLIIEISTKVLGLTILFITFTYGFMYLIIGLFIQQFLQLIITSVLINRLCFNNNFSQIKIVLPILFFCVFLNAISYLILQLLEDSYILQGLVGVGLIFINYSIVAFFYMKNDLHNIIKGKFL